jgi:ethanolamine utilization cobalamin adenosyltransferase
LRKILSRGDAESAEDAEELMGETELRAGIWVGKDHPRIVFRGVLDSLQADILEAQVLALNEGEEFYVRALGEALDFVREIVSAEVNEREAVMPKLFGYSLDELHEQSHKVKHQMPDYRMGALGVRLNTLRTRVREAELAAVRLSGLDSSLPGGSIAVGLNRLSSAIYWLYCKAVMG